MIGLKHYEVANYLHSIPLNEIFTISLVEPIAWDNRNCFNFSQFSLKKTFLFLRI